MTNEELQRELKRFPPDNEVVYSTEYGPSVERGEGCTVVLRGLARYEFDKEMVDKFWGNAWTD